jgi:anti-sigma regulatory factor (Ser/Thr protein kinase)
MRHGEKNLPYLGQTGTIGGDVANGMRVEIKDRGKSFFMFSESAF